MAEPIDIVRDFCAACEAGDIEAILEFFTDDAERGALVDMLGNLPS